MTRARTFILSPARLDGERARRLLQPGGSSPLAAALRDQGAPIGEVFRFVSSLYFRGKLAYAERFGRGSWVMTANSGLRPVDSVVRLEDLEMFAMTDIGEEEPRFRAPLTRDARALAERIGPQGEVVLLGSIAVDEVRRAVARSVRSAAPLSSRVRRERQHEPRRPVAPRRRGR